MKSLGLFKLLALGTLVMSSGTGCAAKSPGEPVMCTLIGCESGLSIEVKGDRGGDVTVQLVGLDGQQRSFQCDGAADTCTSFFADYMPTNVTVTVTKEQGSAVRSFAVNYRDVRPNGEDCPPICRQGHIDLVL